MLLAGFMNKDGEIFIYSVSCIKLVKLKSALGNFFEGKIKSNQFYLAAECHINLQGF